MNFWEFSIEREQQVAVIDAAGQEYSYRELHLHVAKQEAVLAARGPRSLGFILCNNQLEDISLYLACLRQGHVPLLLSAQTQQAHLDALQSLYKPNWVAFHGEVQNYSVTSSVELHSSLGLLLSTSGTTGSPRLVRLTRTALQANAESIAKYMRLDSKERAITLLPMNYSYGLSVINSQLLVGGTLILNTDSVLSHEFLQRMQDQRVTTLSGVPYTYQMLHRTGFFNQELPALRTLTQAGGHLDEKITRYVYGYAQATGRRFYVMYGQTEACARISYVPPERLGSMIGSIGVPIPGGSLEVVAESSELVYKGPNVMLGYAEQRTDLARGDDCKGRLLTGDVGHMNEDGFFFITGRLKRFIKISGNRVGLDEVEKALEAAMQVPIAVGGTDDRIVVWLESREAKLLDQVREIIRQRYGVHPSMSGLQLVEQLPYLSSGKKDYGALLRPS